MSPLPTRVLRRTLGVGVAVLALAAPASALAASGYVVTVDPGADCATQIGAVTKAYGISPTATYTSSTCGFAARLSRRQVSALQADPGVLSVTADGRVSIG
jgi:hypothetical protein